MRRIVPSLTGELEQYVGKKDVFAAEPLRVKSYRGLVSRIAQLAYVNKDYLLFFRGQPKDFKSRAGSSTIYPTIYRGEYVRYQEVYRRFQILEEGCRLLKNAFEAQQITGYRELVRKKYIQWSMLQHYGVCETPLLDLTHSVRVASSFAQQSGEGGFAYVFVFGLPYLTNRISMNSEDNLVNVRLLSISPPDALRPYFQEGYLAGTTDITTEYGSKTELDFRNRLIAKFEIPNGASFWGQGFSSIPHDVLFPPHDEVEAICKSIASMLVTWDQPEDLGSFIRAWSELERELVSLAREGSDRVHTAASAIHVLSETETLDYEFARLLHQIRKFRNAVVHEPERKDQSEITQWTHQVREALDRLRKASGKDYQDST